ncbi:MAG TPA: hypothetical protein VFI33_02660 [Puia sp.]|nr:hypothetical protein [Puia sp.]
MSDVAGDIDASVTNTKFNCRQPIDTALQKAKVDLTGILGRVII